MDLVTMLEDVTLYGDPVDQYTAISQGLESELSVLFSYNAVALGD
jgi:hypothetical protein